MRKQQDEGNNIYNICTILYLRLSLTSCPWYPWPTNSFFFYLNTLYPRFLQLPVIWKSDCYKLWSEDILRREKGLNSKCYWPPNEIYLGSKACHLTVWATCADYGDLFITLEITYTHFKARLIVLLGKNTVLFQTNLHCPYNRCISIVTYNKKHPLKYIYFSISWISFYHLRFYSLLNNLLWETFEKFLSRRLKFSYTIVPF